MISFIIGMIAGGTITAFFLACFRISKEDQPEPEGDHMKPQGTE